MKRLILAIAMAMLAMLVVAGPVLADGPTVVVSDIEVTDENPPVGTVITFSGTVTIDAASYNGKDYGFFSGATAGANSNAWYVILDPEGNIVASGNSALSDESISWWFLDASADAGQTYGWSVDVLVDIVGEYVAEHGGEASTYFGHWETKWVGGWCGHWETTYYVDGTASDTASAERLVDVHSLGVSSAIALNSNLPVLIIELPKGRGVFFGSDGWDNPTDKAIVYNDGIWQVEIAAGTILQMDGSWHKRSWLTVDSQGAVTGRYGNGETEAIDIGLSQPITITKVG